MYMYITNQVTNKSTNHFVRSSFNSCVCIYIYLSLSLTLSIYIYTHICAYISECLGLAERASCIAPYDAVKSVWWRSFW